MARALTTPSTCGFHDVALPVVASSWAIHRRDAPPILLKNPPPTYTVLPVGAIAYTWPSGFGSHAVAALVPGSTAARLRRDWPAMFWKDPPTYTTLGEAASAATNGQLVPRNGAITGLNAVALPVLASTAPSLKRV